MTTTRRLALRPLRRVTTPPVLVYFDTETDERPGAKEGTVTHHLRFGVMSLWVYDGHSYTDVEWYTFTNPNTFWSQLYLWAVRHKEIYVACHNAHFDWRQIDIVHSRNYAPIYWHPSDAGYPIRSSDASEYMSQRVPLWSIQPRATFMHMYTSTTKITLFDSLNYFPLSLAKLGESLSLHKLPMPSGSADAATWEAYCRRDVEIGARAITRLWETLRSQSLGTPSVTLAGTAMRVWRTASLREPLLIPDRPGLRETHRQAYYGGHVDVARLGRHDGQIWVADVRSLYPSMMSGRMYPTEWVRTVYSPTSALLESYLRRYEAVAQVSIHSDTQVYPLRLHHRVRYVRGYLTTWLAGPELRLALESGHLLSCHELHLFRRGEIFTDYIHKLYTLRRGAIDAKDDANSLIYKLLLNSLYGKFGQRGQSWEYRYDPDHMCDEWTETRVAADGSYRIESERFGPLLRRGRECGESTYSHPAIAAYVTSYGRVYMSKWKSICGKGGWIYSDTDSLMLTGIGYCRWRHAGAMIGSGLGEWSVEGPYPHAFVGGKKDYALGCIHCVGTGHTHDGLCNVCDGCGVKRKIKGVRRNAEIITGTEREEILRQHGITDTTVHGLPVITLRQALWHGLAGVWTDGWHDSVTVETLTKVITRQWTDGYVSTSGWVEPLYLLPGDQQRMADLPDLWRIPSGTQHAPPHRADDTTRGSRQTTGSAVPTRMHDRSDSRLFAVP